MKEKKRLKKVSHDLSGFSPLVAMDKARTSSTHKVGEHQLAASHVHYQSPIVSFKAPPSSEILTEDYQRSCFKLLTPPDNDPKASLLNDDDQNHFPLTCTMVYPEDLRTFASWDIDKCRKMSLLYDTRASAVTRNLITRSYFLEVEKDRALLDLIEAQHGLKECEKKLEQTQNRLKASEEKLYTSFVKVELDAENTTSTQLITELGVLRRVLEQQGQEMLAKQVVAETQLQAVRMEQHSLESALRSTQSELLTAQAKLVTTQSELQSSQAELATTQSELRYAEMKLATTLIELQSAKTNLATTKLTDIQKVKYEACAHYQRLIDKLVEEKYKQGHRHGYEDLTGSNCPEISMNPTPPVSEDNEVDVMKLESE